MKNLKKIRDFIENISNKTWVIRNKQNIIFYYGTATPMDIKDGISYDWDVDSHRVWQRGSTQFIELVVNKVTLC